MRILLLTCRSLSCISTRQMVLLANHLPRPGYQPSICMVGGEKLPAAACPATRITHIDRQRWIDPRPIFRLRQLLSDDPPDLIHVWGMAALRLLCIAGGWTRFPVICTAFSEDIPAWSPLDRWAAGTASRFVVNCRSAAERYRRAGVAPERIAVIPPGIEVIDGCPPLPVNVPESSRVLAAIGDIHPHRGFREAIWALDILAYLGLPVHLLVIGDGPYRPVLERFSRQLRCRGNVSFLGNRADGPALLRHAEVVLVPDLHDGSIEPALAAMAAGRPVVASRLPALCEVIDDGRTGCLVAPGDPSGIARQVRRLLADPSLRRTMGEEGRQHVKEHFPVGQLVGHAVKLYHNGRLGDDAGPVVTLPGHTGSGSVAGTN